VPTQFTSKKEAKAKQTYLKNDKVEGQTASTEGETERRLCIRKRRGEKRQD